MSNNLDSFYSCQYVHNDRLPTHYLHKELSTIHQLSHARVIEGSLMGTINVDREDEVSMPEDDFYWQTFTIDQDGNAHLEDACRTHFTKVERVEFDAKQGVLQLHWNTMPKSVHVEVSYEYEMDQKVRHVSDKGHELVLDCTCESKPFVTPTFDNFFSTNELLNIAANAGTIFTWDFNSALGDTIKEKYESLYVQCVQLNDVLLQKGAKGYFWVACCPEIGSVFQVATAGFYPAPYEEWMKPEYEPIYGVRPQGLRERGRAGFVGGMYSRFLLYEDCDLPTHILLMGCNDKLEHVSHYAKMVIANFII